MSVTASQSQWQETARENIRKDASFSKAHLVINALAATLASYVLFANSPAVVIGAMIVAMLLGTTTTALNRGTTLDVEYCISKEQRL